MAREITVNWTTPSGAHLSVLNFDSATSVAAQRAALGALLTDLRSTLSTSVSANVATEGREFEETTGDTTGFWAESTPYTATGSAASQPVADATMVLFRWRTDQVRAGRRIQGRTFIPGLNSAALNAGNLSIAALTAFNAIATEWVAADVGFRVYSRPTETSPGVLAEPVSGDTWSELAVLRRRRN